MGFFDEMTAMVLQSRIIKCHSLCTLFSYYVIAFSFALMFTDSWFTYSAMTCLLLLFIIY